MGGHASGEIASQVAADALLRFLATERFGSSFPWPTEALYLPTEEGRALDAGVRLANVQVYAAALGNPQHRGMGTTVVGLLAGPERVGLVHVGDSRIYRLRGGEFEQLTEDHSLLNHYMRTRP
jgi:protein phosphatase